MNNVKRLANGGLTAPRIIYGLHGAIGNGYYRYNLEDIPGGAAPADRTINLPVVRPTDDGTGNRYVLGNQADFIEPTRRGTATPSRYVFFIDNLGENLIIDTTNLQQDLRERQDFNYEIDLVLICNNPPGIEGLELHNGETTYSYPLDSKALQVLRCIFNKREWLAADGSQGLFTASLMMPNV